MKPGHRSRRSCQGWDRSGMTDVRHEKAGGIRDAAGGWEIRQKPATPLDRPWHAREISPGGGEWPALGLLQERPKPATECG